MHAILALEDGTWFEGKGFGAAGETGGEVIFNTGMCGYQEILTDPSYKQQMVCMTYPHMGNYGINPNDIESNRIQVAGFIVKECCTRPSNWQSTLSLPNYLKNENILGIQDIETRALTRHIRIKGAMRGYISTEEKDPQKVIQKARKVPEMEGLNLVDQVSPNKPYFWSEDGPIQVELDKSAGFSWPDQGPRVLVFDYGAKWNILRQLKKRGAQVLCVPAYTSFEQVRRLCPEAIFLSNGPGDPAALPEIVHTAEALTKEYPIGGICLGHQILGIALGGQSYKLKFGHHGVNHPVKDLRSRKIEISSQNHGFCVDISQVQDLEQTHINLNDNTLEGFVHKKRPIMAVQYHPEASPGPHDSNVFFDDFMNMVKKAA